MIIIEPKRVKLLDRLANQKEYKGLRELSKGIYSSLHTCIKTLEDFEGAGLIEISKDGRKRARHITQKGLRVHEIVTELKEVINS